MWLGKGPNDACMVTRNLRIAILTMTEVVLPAQIIPQDLDLRGKNSGRVLFNTKCLQHVELKRFEKN